MKHLILAGLFLFKTIAYSQKTSDVAASVGIAAGIAALTFLAADADKKAAAKEITQFRSKEYIINEIIGPIGKKEVKFETESLASDDSAGLISVAMNCDEVNEKGLLLAFFGSNRDLNGRVGTAYAFRYIPLKLAQELLIDLEKAQETHKKYMSSNNDVNNVYKEFEDIKFVFYREGGDKIRVFWNGFEVVWESTAFDRTKRRLDKWFK
jgi:hypothetical protein